MDAVPAFRGVAAQACVAALSPSEAGKPSDLVLHLFHTCLFELPPVGSAYLPHTHGAEDVATSDAVGTGSVAPVCKARISRRAAFALLLALSRPTRPAQGRRGSGALVPASVAMLKQLIDEGLMVELERVTKVLDGWMGGRSVLWVANDGGVFLFMWDSA